MEDFFHIGPPDTLAGGSHRLLAGIGFLPPQLGHGVVSHLLHISSKVLADVLHVSEQVAVAQEGGASWQVAFYPDEARAGIVEIVMGE